MIRCRLVFTFSWLILVTACVNVGPKYIDPHNENPSRAVVLIYRLHPPVDLFLTNTYAYTHAPYIYFGDSKLTNLNVNTYTRIEVDPGTQIFSAREVLTGLTITSVEVDAKAGQKYYLRYDFRVSVITGADISFKMVPGPIGEHEITKTRYAPAVDQ